MLIERAQQVCVLGEISQISLGQPMKLANGIVRGQSAASATSRTFNDIKPLVAIILRAVSSIKARRRLFFCSREDSS